MLWRTDSWWPGDRSEEKEEKEGDICHEEQVLDLDYGAGPTNMHM